jgi:hypothetical protein
MQREGVYQRSIADRQSSFRKATLLKNAYNQ